MQTYELCCDMIDVVIDVSCIYGYDLTDMLIDYLSTVYCSIHEEVDSAAYDTKSSSIIKLNNNTVLYLREVNRCVYYLCYIASRPPLHTGI